MEPPLALVRCLRAATALLLVLVCSAQTRVAPSPLPAYAVQYKEYKFDSCQAARDFFAGNPEIAWAHYTYNWRYSPPAIVKSQDKLYLASAVWDAGLRPDSIIVELPKLIWPEMTATEGAGLVLLMKLLRAHEESHIIIAARIMERSARKLSATGTSPGNAEQALIIEIDAHTARFDRELNEAQTRYDELTEHGRRQERAVELDLPKSRPEPQPVRCG